jgi:hypothetical protein
MSGLLHLLGFLTAGDPCFDAPTISTCSVSNTQAGDCSITYAEWTVTVTLSKALPAAYELRYYVCVNSSQSCSPSWRATQTGLSYVYEHTVHQQASGPGATTWWCNAHVEVVPVGTTAICDTLAATEVSANPYRGCFD